MEGDPQFCALNVGFLVSIHRVDHRFGYFGVQGDDTMIPWRFYDRMSGVGWLVQYGILRIGISLKQAIGLGSLRRD